MRISDWSSDVCSSDLRPAGIGAGQEVDAAAFLEGAVWPDALDHHHVRLQAIEEGRADDERALPVAEPHALPVGDAERSEEHTSELQSLMRISYAVFCLKKKKNKHNNNKTETMNNETN